MAVTGGNVFNILAHELDSKLFEISIIIWYIGAVSAGF